MQPGDIVKLRYNGYKQKFQILGVHDLITDNCIQAVILQEWPMCYEHTLQYAKSVGLENIRFAPTNIGVPETVSDDHTHRIYLRKLTTY